MNPYDTNHFPTYKEPDLTINKTNRNEASLCEMKKNGPVERFLLIERISKRDDNGRENKKLLKTKCWSLASTVSVLILVIQMVF